MGINLKENVKSNSLNKKIISAFDFNNPRLNH